MNVLVTLFLVLLGSIKTLSFPAGCAVDEWQCSDGACIQLTSKCDNIPDCSDGSDEQKCSVSPVCLEGLESCPQPNGTTICVDKAIGCGCGLVPAIAHGIIYSNNNTLGSSANVTCDIGYETAKGSILCQDTGIWETALCSPKDCGPVEKIKYGTIHLSDINNTTFGASRSVICDEGYESLTPITECRENGKWDSVICTVIDCGPPPSIWFGNITLINGNNSTVGAMASVTCVDNYAANTSTITCKVSGEWEQASCFSTGCGPIHKISHGNISATDKSSSGSSANVTCDTGYKANISTVTCKSSGEWEQAKCFPIDCGTVPWIAFGKITLVDLNNTTYGASASTTCDTGYTANVSAVLCQSSGVWEPAVCSAIDCGPVPAIAFGTGKLIDNNSSTYKAFADVTCDTGFEANVLNIMCQSSGIWETAVCTVKDCGPVPVIPFGNVNLLDDGNTTYGASANVTCERGFKTSDLKIKCQNTGVWQTATCKAIDCGQVPAIAFGTNTLIDKNNTAYGASAYVACDTGYETNVLNIMCQSSGIWETAVCKAKDCGLVPAIAFGTTKLIDERNTSYGATAHLTCDIGYETNASNVMCRSSGLWEIAVCKAKDCGPVPDIAFGTFHSIGKSNTTYGEYVYLTCDKGFEANKSSIACLSTGLWETAICKAKDCGQLPVVPFGNMTLTDDGNTTYGASAYVTCESGFETNDLKIKCQSTGVWETTVCKAKDCCFPPTVSFGNISLNAENNSTVGAKAFVNCNENYVASRPIIICQSTGIWNNATCFSKGCSSVPTISNGKIKVKGTPSVGSFANVTCDVGYEASISSIMCQASGIWETAECTLKECISVPTISNGNIKISGTTSVGSFANVTCYFGYEASVSSIMCQASGIWETAECKLKACGRVQAIKHGKINLIDGFHTSVGDSANVICDTGYETSQTRVFCQSSGVWESAICTAKDCDSPPMISNGNITLENGNMSTYGAEAWVHCDHKYVANVSKVKCQASGRWEVAMCASEDAEPLFECYKCHKENCNSACNGETEVCKHNKQSCQTIVVWRGDQTKVRKGCKNPTANSANAKLGCKKNGSKIFCRFECTTNLCNESLPPKHLDD